MLRLLDKVKPVLRLFGERQRRVSVGSELGFVEYRELKGADLESFRAHVKESSRGLDRLRWVELNPCLKRVVFAFEPGCYDRDQLLRVVERAEKAAQVDGLPFVHSERQHPNDSDHYIQALIELGGDAMGLVLGLTMKVLPFSPAAPAVAATPVLAILRDMPRFRGWVDRQLGPERSELMLNLGLSLSQGLAQRPVSSLVDVAHKAARLRERLTRSRAWTEREGELFEAPSGLDLDLSTLPSRPIPLPKGPIEEYADRAWLISAAGFLISILTTGSMQRAAAALFGALPKPARLGREIFAAELGRHFARRGIIVLDPSRVRLLDRLDCLVVQGDLISSQKFMLGAVTTGAEQNLEEARARAGQLFDPELPLSVRESEGWCLGPLELLGAPVIEEALESAERSLTQRGEVALGLSRRGQVVGVVQVKVVPQTGVEELIAAAHGAEMRVVVSSVDETALEGLNADDVILDREGLPNGIRRLQREGRIVCMVASGDSSGLPVADIGVGLFRPGEPVPWGAHLICRDDLLDVRLILQSSVAARTVSKQSVNIALGAATMGAIVSAGGLVPMSTRRAMLLVNAATLVAMLNGARSSLILRRKELPPPRDPTPWHALEARGAMARLRSSEHGISRREVARRREPAEGVPTALTQLAEAITDELFNPFAPLLAAGAGLSALVGSTADAGVVAGVVVLNAVVGGVQRFRTERAIRLLARTTKRRVMVRREGRSQEMPSQRLVAGDILLLRPGDVVPADCRILEAESLEVDASSLTGESLPVPKSAAPCFDTQIADRSSMLYEGTSIAAGQATALVVAVGKKTEAQQGAFAAKGDRAQGGVERRLQSLMGLTGPVALAAGLGVVGGGLLRGRRLEDLVGSGVSLAVASVPEGLPLLATAAQLAAAERLSKRGVLVRNVRSIEALGRVDTICLDKTGTVTVGRIELRSVSDGEREQSLEEFDDGAREILAVGLRATPEGLDPAHADPTDEALLRGAKTTRTFGVQGCSGWVRHEELPFEAGRGFHAVIGLTPEQRVLGVKGAPEVILPACDRWDLRGDRRRIKGRVRRELEDEAARLGARGLRVLALAERRVGLGEDIDPTRLEKLSFRGFLAFSDPVRPTAALAIKGLQRAGVNVLMLTGDHPSTAMAIASELNLGESCRVYTGADIAAMSNEQLESALLGVCVFARVTPSQKVRVIRALQRKGRVVAMAGDGANDAPAIRIANVGIAIGERSTAAARGAADVVLTDERIETLVDAVVEGRAMWASVRDAVSVLVGGNLGEIGFTLGAGLVDGRPPLNARQLLLVNLLTDAAPSMAIALRPPTRATLDSMINEGPEASLGKPLNRDIATRAAVTALGAGAAWSIGRFTGSLSQATTMGLVAVVGTQLGQTFVSGGANVPVILTGVGSAAALMVLIQTPGVSRFFGCRPLGPLAWTAAMGSSAVATYLSVAGPRYFEELADRFHQELARAPWVDESAVAGVAPPRLGRSTKPH